MAHFSLRNQFGSHTTDSEGSTTGSSLGGTPAGERHAAEHKNQDASAMFFPARATGGTSGLLYPAAPLPQTSPSPPRRLPSVS
eukprot:gene16236-biopygen5249